jgi:hypothetical protein
VLMSMQLNVCQQIHEETDHGLSCEERKHRYCILNFLLLGNSGKPVTLETSGLMKFVMQVFMGKELAKICSLELTKSRSRECAVVWSPELSKPRSRERALARNLEPAKPRSC